MYTDCHGLNGTLGSRVAPAAAEASVNMAQRLLGYVKFAKQINRLCLQIGRNAPSLAGRLLGLAPSPSMGSVVGATQQSRVSNVLERAIKPSPNSALPAATAACSRATAAPALRRKPPAFITIGRSATYSKTSMSCGMKRWVRPGSFSESRTWARANAANAEVKSPLVCWGSTASTPRQRIAVESSGQASPSM